MNNPLNLTIEVLPGAFPSGAVILAAQLETRQSWLDEREALLASAQEAAAQQGLAAQQIVEQAQCEADAIRAAARQEAQTVIRAARDDAVADAVQWLCSEQNLEQRIARQLTLRWRHVTAWVLEEVLGQHDQNELVLRRVERKVAEWLPKGRLTLSVPPAALPAASQVYHDTPEVTVIPDPELSNGQARLDTGLVRINLDTPAQQSWLLEQLVGDVRSVAHA